MKKILMCFVLTLFVFCGCFVFSACGEKPKDLNITFDYGYDSTINEITIKEGNLVSVPETPVRDGYEFAGWYENEKLEKEFDFSKPVNVNTTIYADWVSNDIQDLFSWVEVDGGIKLSSVVGGTDTMLPRDLIIPRIMDGQKVVELENELFLGQTYPEPQFELTTIKIPYGITKIGDYCFKDCYNLQSITIPETVTSIGIGIFKMSSANSSNLERVTIPSTITTLPVDMFYNCSSLSYVDFPENCKYIDDNAFYGCVSLTNIVLPNSLEIIGQNAFYRCYKNNLTQIPSSVKIIKDSAFVDNVSIGYVYVPGSINYVGNYIFQGCYGTIIKTKLTGKPLAWSSIWNCVNSARDIVPTIYDCENNNLSFGDYYIIQDNYKYLLKTDGTDNHKYLSLEYCFKNDEKLIIDTKAIINGTEYAVEEINENAFNRNVHNNVTKLIFNEGLENSKFTLTYENLSVFMRNIDYIILPASTQALDVYMTYNAFVRNKIKVFTTLTESDVAMWTFKANGETFYYPETYTIGEWELVEGEPTIKE